MGLFTYRTKFGSNDLRRWVTPKRHQYRNRLSSVFVYQESDDVSSLSSLQFCLALHQTRITLATSHALPDGTNAGLGLHYTPYTVAKSIFLKT